jgi:RND family efflux transporter MFP subunit
MKNTTFFFVLLLSITMVSSCEEKSEVEQKKAQLAEYKKQLFELKTNISELEKELLAMGAVEPGANLTLVSTLTVRRNKFVHKVDVRGAVKSRNNILISAEVPGTVTGVKIVEGQQVKKGQILIVQDAQVLIRSIKELESALSLAQTIYERQKKLWENNIGTEVQYLEAKNRKESLELKLATTRSELSKTRIKAPFSGVIDRVDIRNGEIAQPGVPVIRLVSLSRMYIKADVSESFVGKFKKGQQVQVYFPSTDRRMSTTISAIGQVINPKNRTFVVEVRISDNDNLKPNMIAVLTLTDYVNNNAITVPTNLIQTDRTGKFLYNIEERDGRPVAVRTNIETGISFGSETEVLRGLTVDEIIVNKGGFELSDGSLVKIVDQS